MKTIYYYGSTRREKVIPAVAINYKVVDATDNLRNLLPAINQIWWHSPSLLIIDTPHFVSGVLVLVARIKRVPYIVRLRGGVWDKLKDTDDWNFLLKAVKFGFRNLILRRANAIITVSEFLKIQVRAKLQSGSLPPMAAIYNIVQPEEGNPQAFREKLGIPEDSKIMLTVTSFSTYKKYEPILDFANSIIDLLARNEGWRWIILGRGYAINKLENELYQRALNLLFERRILFGNYYEPIWDAYAATDILIQMSYRETMGNPLLEAQSVGKIVLCNDSGGMPELVRSGLVYHNQVELWQKLNQLINIDSEVFKINLRKMLKEDMRLFSKEHLAELWRTEIEKVLWGY